MNLIIVPSQGRDNAKLSLLYHLLDTSEAETAYKVEVAPFSDIWKFYGDFVNPAIKSIWPDDDY